MFSLEKIYGTRGCYGNMVSIGNIDLFFSYKTVVAFRTLEDGLICCENVWGSTSGGHLNKIADKEDRLSRSEFLAKLDKLVETRFK